MVLMPNILYKVQKPVIAVNKAIIARTIKTAFAVVFAVNQATASKKIPADARTTRSVMLSFLNLFILFLIKLLIAFNVNFYTVYNLNHNYK